MRRWGGAGQNKASAYCRHGVAKPVSAAREGWMNSNLGSFGSTAATVAILYRPFLPGELDVGGDARK